MKQQTKVEDTVKANDILEMFYNKNLGFLSITYEQVIAAMEAYKQASLPVSPVTTDEAKLNYFRAGYKYYRSFYSSITTFDDDSEETVKVGFEEFIQSLNNNK